MTSKPTRGYRPTEPPQPPRLTLDEFAQFKRMFEDSPLAKYVIMAGISGMVLMVIELVRVGAYLYQHFK